MVPVSTDMLVVINHLINTLAFCSTIYKGGLVIDSREKFIFELIGKLHTPPFNDLLEALPPKFMAKAPKSDGCPLNALLYILTCQRYDQEAALLLQFGSESVCKIHSGLSVSSRPKQLQIK